MNNLKKSLVCICLIVFLGFSTVVNGAEEENVPLADYLYDMGLFKGTGQGYDLDEITTRAHGAVMVVRLLGKEQEALSMKYAHPFLDVPPWASPYIGYMWKNNITKGIDETTYGADKLINASEYMTFLIRVLGYDDSQGDFSWDKSLQKASSLGIITSNEYSSFQKKISFLRDDMVFISYAVLETDLKNGMGISLLRKLMDEGAVPQTAMLDYKYAPYLLEERNFKPKDNEELQQAVIESILAFDEQVILDISESSISPERIQENIDQAIDSLIDLPGYFGNVDSWNGTIGSNQIILYFDYKISKSRFNQSVHVAKSVASQIITNDMTDYERELAIHDYIVDGTKYYLGDNLEIYTMYGVLVDKKAVCQGYAEAFLYLSTLAGLDSEMVIGDGLSNGTSIPHAWNTVEIEGEWYQVDTTWDDPVSPDGKNIKTYEYFNITNQEMALDHVWDTLDYRIGTGTKYNYYVFNNKIVNGQEGLKLALQEGFNNRKENMDFKVIGEKISANQFSNILNGYNVSCSYRIDEDKGIVEISKISY
jgi:hypothetical protein